MKTKKIALQMDALHTLNWSKDSTLFLAHEALLRGFHVFHYEPSHLFLWDGVLKAQGHSLHVDDDGAWHLEDASVLALKSFDVILIRQDPPFDMGYLTATWLLECLEREPDAPRIINHPRGLRQCPEKLGAACFFPALMPPTLVTRDIKEFEAFRKIHADIVIKPLYEQGGKGIFVLTAHDKNATSAFETLCAMDAAPVMVQRYCPAIETTGDKRLIVIDGTCVGGFTRLAAQGEGRANLVRGGTSQAAEVRKEDQKIVKTLAPFLKEHGLFFAGLDVIGDHLTEINVTSPTGLVDLHRLAGINASAFFWDHLTG